MNTNQNTTFTTEANLDRLFTDFFKSELKKSRPMPRPWADTTVSTPTARTLPRARWALAASVALLLGTCWYLSDKATDGAKARPDGVGENGVADKKILDDLHKNAPQPLPLPMP